MPSSWQRHDQIAYTCALDDLVEILGSAEHGHVTPANLGDRARVVVEKANRRQPVLGMVIEAPCDLRSDQTGAHDQHGLAHQPAAASEALCER
jgi:hypothetical protein